MYVLALNHQIDFIAAREGDKNVIEHETEQKRLAEASHVGISQ